MPNAEGRMETLERVQDWWQRLAMSARPVCLDGDDVRVIAAESANALAAARAENERMRAENVAADGTARAAVELVQDCREVLGLDRGASLTAAVMRAAKDARRYHALRVFLRPELFDRRWQVTADAEDLLNALAATYSFDAREDVNIDAAIDTLAAQEGTR